MVSSCAISWTNKKQKTTALSTVEAEYKHTGQEAIWLRELVKEIRNERLNEPVVLTCDSNGAIHSAKNRVTSVRTKHIHIRHHFIREKIENKIIDVRYLESK